MLARFVLIEVFLLVWSTTAYYVKRTSVNAALSSNRIFVTDKRDMYFNWNESIKNNKSPTKYDHNFGSKRFALFQSEFQIFSFYFRDQPNGQMSGR